MYLNCRSCGNDKFKITVEFKVECANCGEQFDLPAKRPRTPQPEPRPKPGPEPKPGPKPSHPDGVGPFWFRSKNHDLQN